MTIIISAVQFWETATLYTAVHESVLQPVFFQIDNSTYVITYISAYQIQKQVGNVHISVSNNQLYTYIT